MRVHKSHRNAFLRQLTEATIIMRGKRDPKIKVLNRKQEYDRCLIPSLNVEYQDTQKKMREKEKKKKEKEKEKEKNENENKRKITEQERNQPANKKRKKF